MNTEGHKAKKSRKTLEDISGRPDKGRNYDISTMARESQQSSSTDGRTPSSSSRDDTLGGGDRPLERAQLRNEDKTAELMKKRRLKVEEYSFA
jgi:hypothetical protein